MVKLPWKDFEEKMLIYCKPTVLISAMDNQFASYTIDEQSEIYLSPRLLKVMEGKIWGSKNRSSTSFERLLRFHDSLEKKIFWKNPPSQRYPISAGTLGLKLLNKNNKQMFEIYPTKWVDRFTVLERFDLNGYLSLDICEAIPNSKFKLTEIFNNDGRIYYYDEEKDETYELRFWPLIVNELKDQFFEKSNFGHSEFNINYNVRNGYEKDYFFFNRKTENFVEARWNCRKISNCINTEGIVKISLGAEYQYARAKYRTLDVEAKYDFVNGLLKIEKSFFERYDLR